MRFLVIGLGSMGKRRIRNLLALGYESIAGFDPRDDRRAEAESRYGATVFDNFETAVASFSPDVLIISTDPRLHMDYAEAGVKKSKHCFIEASVVEGERIAKLAKGLQSPSPVVAPSCTMRFFTGPAAVREVIGRGYIGDPLNINYLTGQYLPDWHPWENIQDFYVSNRETGGAREIVPFELTWINEIFGDPEPISCFKDKLSDINADIDDIYHCLLRYPGGLVANISIEVLSRPKATRELHILGSAGRLVYSSEDNCVRYLTLGDADWTRIPLDTGTIEKDYINQEEPYISELDSFIKAVHQSDRFLFPNTLEDDARTLALLNQLEELSQES